jgi:hypothetical protein
MIVMASGVRPNISYQVASARKTIKPVAAAKTPKPI